MTIIKKTRVAEGVEKEELLYIISGNINCITITENSMEISQKLKVELQI